MLDLVVCNGTVVLPDETRDTDVGVLNGKIVKIGRLGERKAKRRLNAANQYVFPGMIDPHVHICHPFRDIKSADDFYSGTCAAVIGGNTSIIDFAIQWTGSPQEALAARMSEASNKAIIDYTFHACLTKAHPSNIACVSEMIAEGIPSFKVYMVYGKQGRMMDDGGLLAMLLESAGSGAIVNVHAENEAIADYNELVLVEDGRTKSEHFPEYKPNIVEAEAIHRVLYLNEMAGSRLNIFHLSTREGLELVAEARRKGQDVSAETCTHYLHLTDDHYRRKDGRNYICSPPLRSQEDVDAMWSGVESGVLSVISSDHCGFSTKHKHSYGSDFFRVPNGLPGIETRLPVVHHEGVVQGRISINKMVEVLSSNPAKLFGLYPRKGTIAIGADADITIFDPSRRRIISAKELETPAGWSPYDGLEVHGWPTSVISRGEVIMSQGHINAVPGRGEFMRRLSVLQ